MDEDAALARRLQAEEDERARKNGGTSRDAMTDYANTPLPPSAQNYGQSQQELPPREQKKGLFSKLLGGKTGSSSQYGHQQQYGGQQYPPQQQYNQYPQQGGYGGGGGYQQQQQYYPQQSGYGGGYQQQQPAPKKSGGLGTMGGAALGLGGGLIGGMLLEDAIQDHDQNEYDQGCKFTTPIPMQCVRAI